MNDGPTADKMLSSYASQPFSRSTLNFSKSLKRSSDDLIDDMPPGDEDGIARATLIGVYDNKDDIDWRQAEMVELASTAGVQIEHRIAQVRPRPDAKFVVGRGKLEEVVLQCLDEDIELLIFDNDLTPAQARSLASSTDLKIIDRTQLILDIFAQHASSRDGKLQVELAQLRYNLPRLTEMDAGLSRLTGGIGGRGPGKTKLEINRRRAGEDQQTRGPNKGTE